MSKIYESEADLPWAYARNPDLIATLRDRDRLRAEVERLKADNARLLTTCHLSSGSTAVKCGQCAACLTSELNLRESALNSERLAHSATCRELERLKGQLRIETEAAVNEQGRAAHLEAENERLRAEQKSQARAFEKLIGELDAAEQDLAQLKAERESLREHVLERARFVESKGGHLSVSTLTMLFDDKETR